MLPRLKEMVERQFIPDVRLPDLLQSLDDFLHYECGGKSGRIAEDSMCHDAAEWLRALTPVDFARRLKVVIGKDPWHHSMREEISGIASEIVPLAEEVNRNPAKLETVLSYLNSPEAVSAALFGDALAGLDTDAKFMDGILSAAASSGSNALARGYIGRLVSTRPNSAERLNTWLDRFEEDAPELAYTLSLAAPDFARPLERTLRLIRTDKLPVHSLQNFIVGMLLDRMSSAELSTILDLLVQAGDPQSLHIAVDFVGHSVQRGRISDTSEREAMWRALEASAPVDDRADYWWVLGVRTFAPEAPERACETAILALTGEDHEKRDHAWSILSILAKTHPDLVMESVGRVLLNPEQGWRLRILRRSGLFQALPLESVRSWLARTGIEGARLIANHLQPPFLDNEGNPQIHPLTEYVLATWGDDQMVFGRFAASTHHLQMYSGDIASSHRKEAERARPFLSHPISAVRRWAEHEVASGEEQARQWAIRNEEQLLK
jgi:hypothetical protein